MQPLPAVAEELFAATHRCLLLLPAVADELHGLG